MASDPNQVFLGAPSFTGAGYALIGAGAGITGGYAGTTLNVDTGLTHPLRKPSFDPRIYLINGEIGPLLTLLQKKPMTRFQTSDNFHYWTEDRMPPEKTTATGSTAVGGTNIAVTFVDMFLVNSTVWVPDAGDAYGLVTAVTGSGGAGSITVSWFTGLAPTVAITAGTAIYTIGNTQPEIGVPIASPFTQKVQKYCVMQEFWYAREVSDRLVKERWQIGTPLGAILPYETDVLKRRAQVEAEKTLWFGQQSWAAATGIGTLEGLYYATGARRWNYGAATLSQANFETFIDRGRRHRWGNIGETIVFMSTSVARQINAFPAAAQRIQPGETRYGIQLHRWIPEDGKSDALLMVNPLFDALGRDDLMCSLRMEPEALAFVQSTVYPELTYQDMLVPLGASYNKFGFKWRFSERVKDAFGHVNWMYNIGSAAAGALI